MVKLLTLFRHGHWPIPRLVSSYLPSWWVCDWAHKVCEDDKHCRAAPARLEHTPLQVKRMWVIVTLYKLVWHVWESVSDRCRCRSPELRLPEKSHICYSDCCSMLCVLPCQWHLVIHFEDWTCFSCFVFGKKCHLWIILRPTWLLDRSIGAYWKEPCSPLWLQCHAVCFSTSMWSCCSPWGVSLCSVRRLVTFFCITSSLQTLYRWWWAS